MQRLVIISMLWHWKHDDNGDDDDGGMVVIWSNGHGDVERAMAGDDDHNKYSFFVWMNMILTVMIVIV